MKTLQKVAPFVIIGLVQFQSALADDSQITNPISSSNFQELAGGIAKQLAVIAPSIGIFFIVLGGLQYVLAGDSEEKVKKAHKTLTWALIGTAVVIGAEILVYAVRNTAKQL
ncbi:hypothetical protein KGQ34_04150 [Patescibacteria group bacterium]|nr:hypothetical protein [Patescibacteria group bacterium]